MAAGVPVSSTPVHVVIAVCFLNFDRTLKLPFVGKRCDITLVFDRPRSPLVEICLAYPTRLSTVWCQ